MEEQSTLESEITEEVHPEFSTQTSSNVESERNNSLNESAETNKNESNETTKVTKPRVLSALTVQNLRDHDENTEPLDVAELMNKTAIESTDQSQNTTEEHLPAISNESPAVREVTKGLKFTGEEYIAVSIDVQTDQSWLNQLQFEEKSDDTLLLQPRKPYNGVAATDNAKTSSNKSFNKRKKKHITSDLSTSDFLDSTSADEEIRSAKFKPESRKSSSYKTPGESTTSAQSETDEDNPITQINFTGSEFGESEIETNSTNTISSVGPPYILQYKAESKAPTIDYNKIEATIPPDLNWDSLSLEDREYYEKLISEMEVLRKEKEEEASVNEKKIDIEPHAAFGSQQDRKMAKERDVERMKAREVERQKHNTVTTNQTNFYAFARQLKTVNYSLSSEKCMDEGWTIRPKTPPPTPEPTKEFFVQESGTDIVSAKRYHQTFLEKYYDNGQLFLAVFSDGTGCVRYRSGNLAISIIAAEKPGKLIFIVQEDKENAESPSIQAVFEPNGNCVCYHPNGSIRVILSSFGGEYMSPFGEKLKKWKWKDEETHVHAPPFQPITFGLSKQVGIRIIAQEFIYLTFSDGKKSARFNVGTLLRLKQAMPEVDTIDVDTLVLHEKVAYLQSLMERIHHTFKFPNSPRLQKLRLSNHLTSKIEKTAQIRARWNSTAKLPPIENKIQKLKSKKSKEKKKSKRLRTKLEPIPLNDITATVSVN